VRVVCISRSLGAGGDEIGRLVADRLEFRLVDEEIVAQAAKREGLDPKDVASAEQRKGWLARLFEATAKGGPEPELSGFGTVGSPGVSDLRSSEMYRELIKEAILETARHGSAVIVAHAASHALADHDEVLRVFVTASPAIRSGRLAEAFGLDEAEAINKVEESDAARADYLRRFYDVKHELPTHYDLVINTDKLSAEEAASLIHAASLSAGHISAQT
jgi:cytidylate kinase